MAKHILLCLSSEILLLLLLLLSFVARGFSSTAASLENAALNKPTSQGPRTHRYYDYYYESSFAVDGDINTLFHFCAAVDTDNVMWWIVDLTRSRKIHSVRILSRANSDFRLENFTVDGFDDDPRKAPGFPRNFGQICASRVDKVGAAEWAEMTCAGVIETRFVRIVKHGYAHLALCEVQVLAEVIGNETTYTSAGKYAAEVESKSKVGKFETAVSCAVALVQDREHNGFQFNRESRECLSFQNSPLRGDDGVESSTVWNMYTVV